MNLQSPKELVYAASTDTVRKLLAQQGIPAVKLEQNAELYPHLVQHAVEWMGPIILFTAAAISQNTEVVSITLGVISNYLTDWFRGVPKEARMAQLKMVEETKDGRYKLFDYSGPPENLGPVKDVMDRFYDERQN